MCNDSCNVNYKSSTLIFCFYITLISFLFLFSSVWDGEIYTSINFEGVKYSFEGKLFSILFILFRYYFIKKLLKHGYVKIGFPLNKINQNAKNSLFKSFRQRHSLSGKSRVCYIACFVYMRTLFCLTCLRAYVTLPNKPCVFSYFIPVCLLRVLTCLVCPCVRTY